MSYGKQLIGQTLGTRYKLVRWIGGGGFADVYEAEDLNLANDRVAVKVLKPEFADRVSIEARIARKFRHPNVVAVTDMKVDGEIPYIVMELLEGRTVDQLCPLSVPLLRKFVLEICSALQNAHDQGLVHRDLKLQNIILVDPGTARQQFKILDFGIASQVNVAGSLLNESMNGGGTIEYMPPEHLCTTGVKPGPKTDIYAIGVILYELLMGRKPFKAEGQNILTTLKQIEFEPPPRFCEIDRNCQIDSAIESLVLQCLSKSPDMRPASMGEIADRFLESYGVDETGRFDDSRPMFNAPLSSLPVPQQPLEDLPDDYSLSFPPIAEATQPPLKKLPPAASVASPAPPPPPAKPAPAVEAKRPAAKAPVEPAANATLIPADTGSRTLNADEFPEHPAPPAPASPPERKSNPYEQTHLPPPAAPVTSAPPTAMAPPSPKPRYDGTIVPDSQQSLTFQKPPAQAVHAPISDHDVDEADGPHFNWVRNSIIVVVVLMVVIASTLVAVQRSYAMSNIDQLAAVHRWGDAVLELEAGNVLTFPFVDRPARIREIHSQWVAEINALIDGGKPETAIEECRKINDTFPDDPDVTEILHKLADQAHHRIAEFNAQDDFSSAVDGTKKGSIGYRISQVNPKLFDPVPERAKILDAGLARLQSFAKDKKYNNVIRVGGKLRAEFPENDDLKSIVRRAEVSLVLEEGNRHLAVQKPVEAIAAYSRALAMQPERDLKRECLLQRATAHHAIAAPQIESPAEKNLTLEAVNGLLKPAFADLKEILSREAADKPARKLRSQIFVLRAAVRRRLDDVPGTLCDLKLALTDNPGQKTALDVLTAICGEEGDAGMQHHAKAHEYMSKQTMPDETEEEWQQAIDHLSTAIQSCEVAVDSDNLNFDGRVLPLYYSRADAQFRQAKPNFKGALNDLKSFQRLAGKTQSLDVESNFKFVQALSLQAWIQATTGDASLRNPVEAKAAAQEALARFKMAKGNSNKVDESVMRLESYLLQAVAAAEAANGKFDEAVSITEEALANIEKGTDEWDFHNSLLKQFYLREKAYIEPVREQSTSKKVGECVAE